MIIVVVVLFLAISCYSQSDDDPQEDLAKFGYKLNKEVKSQKESFYIFGYLCELFKKIWQILAIPKKHMILAF
jgi:hypothetical protein